MLIYRIRQRFIVIQLFVLSLFVAYITMLGNDDNLIVVLLCSLWHTLSYAWLFIAEMRHAPDFHPFQILTLSTIQFVGINGLSIFVKMFLGDRIIYAEHDVTNIVYLGLVYLSFQHLLLYFVFFFLEKKYARKYGGRKLIDYIKDGRHNYYKWGRNIYIILWLLRGCQKILPLESLGSTVVAFVSDGYHITLILLLFSIIRNPKDKKSYKLHWAIVVLEAVLGLGTGMKENVIRPIIPYCIYLIITYKAGLSTLNSKLLIRLALIGVFIIAFVFPYISVFRSISMKTGRSWSDITVSETFTAYFGYLSGDSEFNDDEERGSGYLMSRAGSVIYNAWSIDYAQKHGYTPALFAYCSMEMIPRIVWPGKPAVPVGGVIDRLIRGDSNWLATDDKSEYSNYMSLGFIGACYFCFGLIGSIILICFHALYLSMIWNYIRSRLSYNLIAIMILMNIVFLLLKDFEAYKDLGISFVAINTAYIVIAKIFDKNFLKLAKIIRK